MPLLYHFLFRFFKYYYYTCFLSWEQLLKERAAFRGTLFPVFFLLHYFILLFKGGFVLFHFDAKQWTTTDGSVQSDGNR